MIFKSIAVAYLYTSYNTPPKVLVLGVFSTKIQAAEACKKHEKKFKNHLYNYEVHTIVMNRIYFEGTELEASTHAVKIKEPIGE